ncbi:MAG: hypothetical protein GXP51_11825, partial [Deltaproteobacteria bacterium]|nr:hypothetical protein [Deltaproteobacteria bacterium]
KERLEDDYFCQLQKRRGSTEARIGIFKNAYLGTPLRNKGFENRKTRIEWCILAHNLWKLARMAAQQREITAGNHDRIQGSRLNDQFTVQPSEGVVGSDPGINAEKPD